MSKFDEMYLDLCEEILEKGEFGKNRTVNAASKIPNKVLVFDLSEEFPILTTKKVGFKWAALEMLWIYQAQSNDVRWLQERGITIWDEWQADENGIYQGKEFGKEHAHTIGTAYGWIVNKYKLTQNLIETLKNNPTDRRMIMSLWQNEFIPTATLPSCVWCTTWDVTDGRLNCVVNQRSCDVALGLPFNITQYALLNYMLAHVTGLKPGNMTWVIANAHIYENQVEGIKTQLARRDEAYEAPKLWLNPEVKDFFAFDNSKALKDIKLEGYKYHDAIKMEVSV